MAALSPSPLRRPEPAAAAAPGELVPARRPAWWEAAAVYLRPRLLAVLLLGFSSGLPAALIGSTLGIWLTEEGVARGTIGLFALVGVPYALKFLWAPFVDQLPLPWLGRRLGRRRAWGLLSQLALAGALLALGACQPALHPGAVALCALLVGFCSATQDIVIDAWRVETLPPRQQGAGAAAVVFGYRLGMLASGAGALVLAAACGWFATYAAMAALCGVGMLTLLVVSEPGRGDAAAPGPPPGRGADPAMERRDRAAAWLRRVVAAPFLDLVSRPAWLPILGFVVLYKLGDALVAVMSGPFFVELGFDKVEIAQVVKVFGLGATIAGGFVGGVLVYRWGVLRSLLWCGVLQLGSILPFALLAAAGPQRWLLALTIGGESLAAGMATAAFVAFLSGQCRAAYTATQYALLSSLAMLARTVLSSSAGWVADTLGWTGFFLFAAASVVPGLLLLLLVLAASLPEAAPAGNRLLSDQH